MGAVSRFRLANVFGIHFSDVHALPLRIGSLQLSHAFMTLNQLTSQIGRHLLWTVGGCRLPCSCSDDWLMGLPFALDSTLARLTQPHRTG